MNETTRRRFCTAGLAGLGGLLSSGCNLFGPRPSDKHHDRPPPTVTNDRKPSSDELISYLNREAAQIRSIETHDLSMDVKAQGSSFHLEGGALLCQKPKYLKLVGRKLGAQQILVGSNEERFWFYVTRDPSDALFHCSHTDYEKGVELPFPFQSEWVLDALGMSPVGQSESAKVEEDRSTFRLIEETSVRGQRGKKVTVFYKGMAQGAQPQIVSRTIYDSANKIVFVATTQKVQRLPIDRGAGAKSSSIACPEVVKLEWPAQDTSLTIDLGRAKVNTTISMDSFTMPQLGSKQIDLGRDRPTGRGGVVPARFR